jgi:hypothetical protein
MPVAHGPRVAVAVQGGWLAAAREALARAGGGQEAALCGSEGVHGGVRYSCQRKPHPVDGHKAAHRHAAAIDAGYARLMADDDQGEPDIVTWEDEDGDDGENWEVAWGTIAQYDQRARAQGAMMAALPHPLLDALTTAVQLEILTVAPMTPQEREDMLSRMRPAVVPERREFRDQAAYRHARDAATAAADLNPLTHLDDLLYGGTRTSAAFAAITRVLALLACRPGGVRFGPLGWCAAHPRQRWGEADGHVCAACVREESVRAGLGGGR